MKSRFIITLLCVGAVAFACGPRVNNDASTSSASSATLSTARTVSLQGAPRKTRAASKSPITASLQVRSESSSITFALHVVNSGKKSVELTFPSGQTHDFVIVDSLGREVWRWAEGRLFTQALQNKLLSRGESLEMAETWNAPTLKPGAYTAVAILKSENYPLTERSQFVVGGAQLAKN